MSAVRDCVFNIFAATLPYMRPFLHPQPEDAPCHGDRDPLITQPPIDSSQRSPVTITSALSASIQVSLCMTAYLVLPFINIQPHSLRIITHAKNEQNLRNKECQGCSLICMGCILLKEIISLFWPLPVAARSKALACCCCCCSAAGIWVRIPPGIWNSLPYECCVLSDL